MDTSGAHTLHMTTTQTTTTTQRTRQERAWDDMSAEQYEGILAAVLANGELQ